MMTAIRGLRPALLSGWSLIAILSTPTAMAQDTGEQAGQPQPSPPTTLPFAPTVQSAPPERPTYDQNPSASPPPPPPGDPLCYEIGPYIRAGVAASRFAGLSPATMQGAAIGSFEAGEALKALGAGTCTVAVPGANEATATAPYNQMTCPLAMQQSDFAELDAFRKQRDELAERISACPAFEQWTGEAPRSGQVTEGDMSEDFIFTHPDVGVELIVRSAQHRKAGQWPDDYLRTLSLVLRTPNPDRPAPPEPDAG